MITKTKITKTIAQDTAMLQRYGVRRLGIFGSFVHARQNLKSDIDFLVEFKKGKKTFDNYMELKFHLEKLFKRKIDLVIKDALKNSLRKRVLKETEYA